MPTGIPTAVTLPELELLQRFAHEAGTVLEIGTYLGFTAIGMALAGAYVTTIDPHDGGPADAPDTADQFVSNCVRHSADGGVFMVRCRSEDILWNWQYMPQRFGMVFIDGGHQGSAPWRDAEIAMAHLRDPGYIAFHDVTPVWPDVHRAALQLQAKGWREVGRVETLRVYQK